MTDEVIELAVDEELPEGASVPETQDEPKEEVKEEAVETKEESKEVEETAKIEFREVDKPYAEKIEQMLEKHNVPAKDRAELYKAFSALQDEISQEYASKSASDLKEWEEEQGANLVKNKELARRGSAALGFSEEQMALIEQVVGTKALMTKCVEIGSAMSEDTAKGLGGGVTRNEEMSTEEYLNEIFNKAKG